MARALRIEYPGVFYHVASRGNERKDIFLSEGDRELPALRKLSSRPTLQTIRVAVEAVFMDDPARARRVGHYLCRRHTGLELGEICAAYEVGESAVTQASRRVEEEMKQSESVRKSVGMIERELGVSKV